MATITRYVNTASSAGGDGTTNTTSGANRAYASLSEWEAAEQTDLVSDGDVHVVHCEGSTADTTNVVVTGWTTDASNYITIQVDSDVRHDGKWDTGAYRLEVTGVGIDYEESGTKTIGVQIDSSTDGIQFGAGNNHTVESCILKNCLWGVFCAAGSGHVLKNTIGYEIGRAFIGISSSTGSLFVTAYNNTGYSINTSNYLNGGFGRQRGNGQILSVNNVCFPDSASSYAAFPTNATYATGSDYNASDDTSGPGANSVDNLTASDEFVSLTGGSEDLHLLSSSNLVGVGIGPSSDAAVPTTDIDGDARSGTTADIGADEYVAAGATGKSNPFNGPFGGPFSGAIS